MSAAVLVVEDADDVRLLLGVVLRHAGWEVVEAAGGAEALAMLDVAESVALVLLDVQLPEMDGWGVLEAIRRGPRSDLPVVLCTVKASAADRERGWALGADGYLVKPFTLDEVRDAVDDLVSASPEDRVGRRAAALDALRSAREAGAARG